MNRDATLRSIADLLGIHRRHVDALGTVHEPVPDTLSALIAAFGLPPDPAQAVEAIAAARRAAPLRLGPLEIVAAELADPALPLHPPDTAGPIGWHLVYEDGTEAHGKSLPRPAAGGSGEA